VAHEGAEAPAPLPNSYWVLPGRLLAGEHPGAAGAELAQARVARLLEAGVRCFIDLTHPAEMPPYAASLPAEVDYLRKPIRDHGVPDEPGHMADTLTCLRQALQAGRTVYLHCRAGIGRTAMVAACLLVEQGRSGAEALSELNRRWQQSARAQQWPLVPETAAQADYVNDWAHCPEAGDPLLAPDTLAAARGLRARFQGALLGLAVGDAVAVATQFGRPGRFTAVGDMLGGGPFDLPRGGWSDETAMALCLAESLLECDGFDASDQMSRYRRWQQQGYLSATDRCIGITAGTARALAKAQWRRQLFAGSHDPQTQDPEVLSRVTPVVMYFFARRERAEEHAAEAARTTCQAPLALEACRALARGLHSALSGEPKAGILARAAAPGSGGAPTAPTAAAALATALEVFGGTGNFRDAVLTAANLGGNSDVVTAVAGALAGAHYNSGASGAIPPMWRNSLIKKQLIEEYADRLLTHAMLELGT
jgi:ADP-ribosylglycohydrolase